MNYCKKIIKKQASSLIIKRKLPIQRTKNVLNFGSLFFTVPLSHTPYGFTGIYSVLKTYYN